MRKNQNIHVPNKRQNSNAIMNLIHIQDYDKQYKYFSVTKHFSQLLFLAITNIAFLKISYTQKNTCYTVKSVLLISIITKTIS